MDEKKEKSNVIKTVEDAQWERFTELEKRKLIFEKIGYKSPGVFLILFPNGKAYLGRSKSMGKRIELIVENLLPYGRSTLSKPSVSWAQLAKEENNLTTIKDLTIKVWYSKDYKERFKLIRREIAQLYEFY